MKKLYTLIALCSFTGFGFGQAEIRLTEGGLPVGNDVSGTTHETYIANSASTIIDFQVKNTSGSAQQWKIMRYRVNTPPAGWGDNLFWGPTPDPDYLGQGYAPGTMNSNPWTSPQAMPIETYGKLTVYVTADDPGCGVYRYIIMEGSTKVDSIDVEICSTLSVAENEKSAEITAYPNPANGQLTIATTGLDGNYEIRITDVLGKVVYTETASGAKKNIDVSGFKNGVYLVTILEKGIAVQTRRVVVKH